MCHYIKKLIANKEIGLSVFLMALFLAVSPVFAQDQPPSPDNIVTMMQSKLDLTQDQVAAVMPIIEKYASKRQELRQSIEDGTADRDSIHSQMKQLKADESQELSQVLSADQLGLWEQMQNQEKHKHSEGQNEGIGTAGSGGIDPGKDNAS